MAKEFANPFYKTDKWKKKRANILRRDEYLCQECKRYGKTTAAVTVHHIHPLEIRPEWKLLSWNLISLCNTCHDAMHNRRDRSLTAKGMELVERIQRYAGGLLNE